MFILDVIKENIFIFKKFLCCPIVQRIQFYHHKNLFFKSLKGLTAYTYILFKVNIENCYSRHSYNHLITYGEWR